MGLFLLTINKNWQNNAKRKIILINIKQSNLCYTQTSVKGGQNIWSIINNLILNNLTFLKILGVLKYQEWNSSINFLKTGNELRFLNNNFNVSIIIFSQSAKGKTHKKNKKTIGICTWWHNETICQNVLLCLY